MSKQDDRSQFRPDDGLDPNFRQEIDDALGGMSLEDLLEAEQAAKAPAPATAPGVRQGRVIAIHGEDIFVDMSGKSQGVLPVIQYDDAPLPAEGDLIEVVIEGYDRSEGFLRLSRKGAVQTAQWETLEEGQMVEGRVTDHNKGGLELDVNGIRVFLPVSHIELFRVEDLAPYVNQKLRCQVIEVNRAERNVIVSRRAVLEVEAAKAREEAFEKLAEGQTVRGIVKTVMPYGAFVDIGGVDGLLHVSDMSYSRVNDPHEVVKQGQSVEVRILKVDKDTRRIGLGLKQVKPDPWIGADTKWSVDDIVTGRITRLADFGAFVELEEGVEGLLPISEMTFQRRIQHPKDVVKEGDVIKLRVLSVDGVKKRISLSLKRVGDDPWMGATVRWPQGSIIEGIVQRVAEFGAFVELAPGVDGLVHVSELSTEFVRNASDAVHEGDRVRAKVLAVEEDRRRILAVHQAGGCLGPSRTDGRAGPGIGPDGPPAGPQAQEAAQGRPGVNRPRWNDSTFRPCWPIILTARACSARP